MLGYDGDWCFNPFSVRARRKRQCRNRRMVVRRGVSIPSPLGRVGRAQYDARHLTITRVSIPSPLGRVGRASGALGSKQTQTSFNPFSVRARRKSNNETGKD